MAERSSRNIGLAGFAQTPTEGQLTGGGDLQLLRERSTESNAPREDRMGIECRGMSAVYREIKRR
jgi:hypothetical protein